MLNVHRATGVIGAEISGVDLSRPLAEDEVSAIKDALHQYYVVFFRNQKPLSDEEHIRLGQSFGTLDISEIQPAPGARREVLVLDQQTAKGGGSEYWHRDRTYLEAPPMGSILQCMQPAEVGGDTCWASAVEAYQSLSEPIRTLVDGLSAVHSIKPLAARSEVVAKFVGDRLATWPTAIHPLVEVHPVSGQRALNVNANWTTEIVGLSREEGQMLLSFLLDHVKRPEFQVRFRWNLGDVAFWDNRTTLHCAIADYDTRRIMKRVAIAGHPPRGPQSIN